ncbi:phospholipase D alpha 1 [Arthrobacter sp. Hiyo8]|nr:phospholipase D alpha 1 [Arthrobacter sp. Hiyo8]
MLHQAAPDRVGVFDLENSSGTPIYVHAKICIIDDMWFTCGSDNFNRRSWTTDSELTCAVFDATAGNREPSGTDSGHDIGAGHDAHRPLARGLRLQLWAEHLGLDQDDPQLHDIAAGLKLWNTAADRLDHWHESGRRSPRPTGNVRRHTPEPVSFLQRLWADPLSRFVVDPDGRPAGCAALPGSRQAGPKRPGITDCEPSLPACPWPFWESWHRV